MVLKPMASTGAEGVGSMGDDTPLAVLSLQPRLLYTYFKQLFAQVTNPPIDPIREKLVMSLNVTLGWRRNLLAETAEHARLVRAESPDPLRARTRRAAAARRCRITPPPRSMPPGRSAEGEAGLERAIDRICAEAEAAVREGARIVVLSRSRRRSLPASPCRCSSPPARCIITSSAPASA